MPDESRIPRNLNEYVQYMKRTTDFLGKPSPAPFTGKNWERFNWTETELSQWESFTKTAGELFLHYSSKAFRTVVIKNKIRKVQSDTVKYNQQQKLLDRIASNPNRTVLTDFLLFRIRRGTSLEKTKRTVHTSSIDEPVLLALKPLGGAMLKIFCRTMKGTGRGHRHKISNSVMIAYRIGTVPPRNLSYCNARHISTHAKFILRLEPSEAGKRIYVFARWYNTKYPLLAGPWSAMHEAVIV